jgi:hypothetical protein
MTRLVLLASLVATGCLTEDELLAKDTYFTGYPGWSTSPADCLAKSTHPYKWDCAFELGLCTDGTASLLVGDVEKYGTYVMDAGIARGTIESKMLAFEVDTATEIATPIVDASIHWQLDTEGRWGDDPFLVTGCP